LHDPVTSLAAYGGVVFPLSLMIEAPILMMLSASTALSRDRASYLLLRRFALWTASGLTALHLAIAFTPLFDAVVGGLMHAPLEIQAAARRGLQIMTPWTLSIAYRRLQQGVMIRFGRSRAVGVGTAVRLGSNAVVLGLGSLASGLPGIVVGTLAVATGVVSEALYAGFAARPIHRDALRRAPAIGEPLTLRAFLEFYLPLAATPVLTFFAMPLCAAAMGRMPRTIESLATWPVLNGLVFTLRSMGFALNEVVVALLDRPGALAPLRRFTGLLAAAVTSLVIVAAATPLGTVWFARVSALPATLVALATTGLWLAAPMPGISAFQSLYQGTAVHSRRTRAITESVAAALAVTALALGIGVAAGVTGIYAAVAAMMLGNATQVWVLRTRTRETFRALRAPAPAALAESSIP
jgi:progressive ankylosis protein